MGFNYLEEDLWLVWVRDHLLQPDFLLDGNSELHQKRKAEIAISTRWPSLALERCRHPAEFWAGRKEFFPFLEFVTIET